MNKKNAESVHFYNRMKMRYNIEATPKLVNVFIRIIKSNQSKAHAKITNRCSLHIILVDNKGTKVYLPFIYDKDRHNIVTVLPQTDHRFKQLMKEINQNVN